jgi:Lrp/AsnC family leucine-responsive transcriptional regulator
MKNKTYGKEGVIKKYVAVVEAEKVDRGLTVFCDITIKSILKR